MEEKSLISLDPFIILEFLVWNVMCIQELKLFPQDFLFTNSNDEYKKVIFKKKKYIVHFYIMKKKIGRLPC